MLERAKEATRYGKYTGIEYARFADDLVILIDAYPRHDWLLTAVEKRLREELAALQVEINEEKSRIVDLSRGESFGFLGFVPPHPQSTGRLACKCNAEAQEANGTAAEAQGNIPPPPIPAHRSGDSVDQPGSARLGELLRGWKLRRVLQLYSRLGRKEGPASPDEISETKGLRLGTVE
jgi:RNA-directed DNA polymerase